MSGNNGEGGKRTIPAAAAAPRRRGRGFRIGLIGGIVVGLVGWGVWAVIQRRGEFPRLAREALVAARDQWRQSRPPNYQLTVVVTGDLQGTYRLDVRGDAVDGTLNGQPVRNRGEGLRYWTIDGMFDVMEFDLDRCEKGAAGASPEERAESRLVLSADFDETLGYPRRYRRLSLQTRRAVEWEITEFRPQ
jgi:hypothetical protein